MQLGHHDPSAGVQPYNSASGFSGVADLSVCFGASRTGMPNSTMRLVIGFLTQIEWTLFRSVAYILLNEWVERNCYACGLFVSGGIAGPDVPSLPMLRRQSPSIAYSTSLCIQVRPIPGANPIHTQPCRFYDGQSFSMLQVLVNVSVSSRPAIYLLAYWTISDLESDAVFGRQTAPHELRFCFAYHTWSDSFQQISLTTLPCTRQQPVSI